MKKLIIKWIILGLIIIGICNLPGIKGNSFWFTILIVAVLTLLNRFIKPVN